MKSIAKKMLCFCRTDAVAMISQKANINQGRQFYTCAARKCNYFEWSSRPAAVKVNIKRYSDSASALTALHIYTDGSCIGNTNVHSTVCPAGWGAVVVSRDSDSGDWVVKQQLYGPVIIDNMSPFSLGATVGSNNTGELSAIGEVLIWLRDNVEATKQYTEVVIHYDSEYAAFSVTGEFSGPKNKDLYLNIRKILEQLRSDRSNLNIVFEHVKGHSNDTFNDMADKLARRGCSGEICNAGRYATTAKSTSALPVKPLTLHVYTDGSCIGNSDVENTYCPAGWGAVFVSEDSDSGKWVVQQQLFGPVILDEFSPYSLGATVGSNNSSELSAIGEALIWLRDNREETKHYTDVVINYDSEYAAKSITGEFNGLKNQNLYLNIRKILEQLRNERSSLQISFKHVKGHSNDPWNDLADKLANRGSSGETCKTGRYAFSKGNGVKRRREETVL